MGVVSAKVKTNVFDNLDIKVLEGNILDFSDSRFVGDVADQNAIIKARELLIRNPELNMNVALNRRHALSKLSRFGTDVSGDGA